MNIVELINKNIKFEFDNYDHMVFVKVSIDILDELKEFVSALNKKPFYGRFEIAQETSHCS